VARIRKHRSKWQVLYRDPATKRERSAGVFRTKVAATRVQLEIEHRVATSRWVDPDRTATTVIFNAWWHQVEPTWLRRAESTRARDASYYTSLIDPHLGGLALTSIDSLCLEQWIATLNDAGYSPATINKAAQLVTRALQEAADRDLIIKNPANRLKGKLPAIEISESRVVSIDEAHQLADAIGGRWEAFVLFAFYAGTRWGETAALRRTKLNLRRGTALIDATLARDLTLKSPKTARSRRTVHLPDPLTRALRSHLDRFYRIGTDPDLVFTASEGGPIRYTNWRRRIWIPATNEAGLEGLCFHHLRHSHATFLIDAGIDPVRVSRRLGHARTSITLDRYSHLLDRDEEAILEVLASSEADQRRTSGSTVAALGG
jgi:integrase